jgi:amidase
MALPTVSLEPSSESPITAQVLQNTVAKIGIKIPEYLVQDYTATLTSAQQAMEMVMAMDGEFEELIWVHRLS